MNKKDYKRLKLAHMCFSSTGITKSKKEQLQECYRQLAYARGYIQGFSNAIKKRIKELKRK